MKERIIRNLSSHARLYLAFIGFIFTVLALISDSWIRSDWYDRSISLRNQEELYESGIIATVILSLGSVLYLIAITQLIMNGEERNLNAKKFFKIGGLLIISASLGWFLYIPILNGSAFGFWDLDFARGFYFAIIGGICGLYLGKSSTSHLDKIFKGEMNLALISILLIFIFSLFPFLNSAPPLSGFNMAEYGFWLHYDLILEIIQNQEYEGDSYVSEFVTTILDENNRELGRFWTILLISLFSLSPLIFIFFAIVQLDNLIHTGKANNIISIIHLSYTLTVVLLFIKYGDMSTIAVETYTGSEIQFQGFSWFGTIGPGFWICGLAPIGFFFKKNTLNIIDSRKINPIPNNPIYDHYYSSLKEQGYDDETSKKYAEIYEENYRKKQIEN